MAQMVERVEYLNLFHAGDPGSIPGLTEFFLFHTIFKVFSMICMQVYQIISSKMLYIVHTNTITFNIIYKEDILEISIITKNGKKYCRKIQYNTLLMINILKNFKKIKTLPPPGIEPGTQH